MNFLSIGSTSKDQFLESEEKSDFQEALFDIHIRNLSVPIIFRVGIAILLLVGGLGEFVRFIFQEPQLSIAVEWRFYFCFSIAILLLILAIVDRAKHWINFLFGFEYFFVTILSGFYLSQLREPHSAGMYIMYLTPLLTIMMPARLPTRTVVTSFSLLLLPGIYLAIGMETSLLVLVTIILSGVVILSIIMGHGIFYRLNRKAFFRGRKANVQKQKIEYLARYDQLTGIYNRREFDKKLTEEFNRSHRYESNLSLLMIDLDFFKDINDNYGHDAGDEVLSRVGEILNSLSRKHLRQSDVPGRFGGEEFCLLLPETDSEGAFVVADRIRKQVKNTIFHSDSGDEFQVTCSIGVAEINEKMSQPEDLIKQADQALYDSKDSGRDTVTTKDTELNIESEGNN